MRRPTLVCGLLLLAGCAAAVSDNSPQGICARKADDDPQVRELEMLSATNTTMLVENERPLKQARQQAINRCLVGMGVQRPGGVEPVYKPPGT
jgi:hypothetical protein